MPEEQAQDWYYERDPTWGYSVRTKSRLRRTLHGNMEDAYVAHRLSNEKDAHLIAASPDLLAACKFALSVMRANGIIELSEHMAEEKLAAAIKKARGES